MKAIFSKIIESLFHFVQAQNIDNQLIMKSVFFI